MEQRKEAHSRGMRFDEQGRPIEAHRRLLDQKMRALATIGMCGLLPIVFSVPGITQYPLTTIGGILVAMLGINMMSDDLPDMPVIPDKNKAKATSCPVGA
jgi:hypothetical protein